MRAVRRLYLILNVLLVATAANGQTMPMNGLSTTTAPGATQPKDTSKASGDWVDYPVRITFHQANTQVAEYPDTSLHTFHRRPYSQPWWRDLGNQGTPAKSLLFMPDGATVIGPSLGYHTFDVYRIVADSVNYYNTNRPYTDFGYRLGSQLEQLLHLMHTQNVKPWWNFAVQYNRATSGGTYRLDRSNHDNASLSTHYQSQGQHYELYGAVTYNHEQQDENGGIVSADYLDADGFGTRSTVPVNFDNQFYSGTRSSLTNTFRDYTILLQHGYTWGKGDTTYNKDSTQYTYKLTPRFRIAHRFELTSEKLTMRQMQPDSAAYSGFFKQHFETTDSIYMVQKWTKVDNYFSLNGFLGKDSSQLRFSVGAGNRVDNFSTFFVTGTDNNNIISNYVGGSIGKEALRPGQWFYSADAQLFLTGDATGNFLLNAALGKSFKGIGILQVGFKQQLNNAPYNDALYKNQYYTQATTLGKESITQLYGSINISHIGLSVGVRNYIMTNYIYLANGGDSVGNGKLDVLQHSSPFNLTQVWGRKVFRFGSLTLDNEIAFQQVAGDAPLHVPTLLGRHQLSIETGLFKHATDAAFGAEVRYHTPYKADGYSGRYNRFYYQDTYTLKNTPEVSAFLNFRVHRFRATIAVDELQSLLGYHDFAAPNYPLQELMIRFGFNWALVN